jgi:hypothetical protein
MHLGLALVERNIAHERQDFDLLAEGDALVLLPFPVEIAHHDVAEGAEGREVAAIEMLAPSEVEEPCDDLVPGVKDQGKRLLALLLV